MWLVSINNFLFGYHLSSALFNVVNIELARINWFSQYILYIQLYVENIVNLAPGQQQVVMSTEQRNFPTNQKTGAKITKRNNQIDTSTAISFWAMIWEIVCSNWQTVAQKIVQATAQLEQSKSQLSVL